MMCQALCVSLVYILISSIMRQAGDTIISLVGVYWVCTLKKQLTLCFKSMTILFFRPVLLAAIIISCTLLLISASHSNVPQLAQTKWCIA